MADRVAIIGASRGIGLALTRLAAARGDHVAGSVRRAADADTVRAAGAAAAPIADITDEASLAAAAREFGAPVDLLVANAGVLNAHGGLDDPAHDAKAWAAVLMTNVAGPFFAVRAFLPLLERSARPRVAIIASVMGSTARAAGGACPYRASKAGAVNLARSLAAELHPRGVAVGAYHPGWVRTDMGGPGASVDAGDAAAGLLARFDALTLARTGVFEDYLGAAIPY